MVGRRRPLVSNHFQMSLAGGSPWRKDSSAIFFCAAVTENVGVPSSDGAFSERLRHLSSRHLGINRVKAKQWRCLRIASFDWLLLQSFHNSTVNPTLLRNRVTDTSTASESCCAFTDRNGSARLRYRPPHVSTPGRHRRRMHLWTWRRRDTAAVGGGERNCTVTLLFMAVEIYIAMMPHLPRATHVSCANQHHPRRPVTIERRNGCHHLAIFLPYQISKA